MSLMSLMLLRECIMKFMCLLLLVFVIVLLVVCSGRIRTPYDFIDWESINRGREE